MKIAFPSPKRTRKSSTTLALDFRGNLYMMADILIDDMAVHLAASKSMDYRERVRERLSVFVTFLRDNGLTTRTLMESDAIEGDDSKILRSDLTDFGFAVVKAAYCKWLRGHDKGKAIDDVTTLQKAIDKIR